MRRRPCAGYLRALLAGNCRHCGFRYVALDLGSTDTLRIVGFTGVAHRCGRRGAGGADSFGRTLWRWRFKGRLFLLWSRRVPSVATARVAGTKRVCSLRRWWQQLRRGCFEPAVRPKKQVLSGLSRSWDSDVFVGLLTAGVFLAA